MSNFLPGSPMPVLREIVRIDINVLPNIQSSQEVGASLRYSPNYLYSIRLQWNEEQVKLDLPKMCVL